MSEKKLRALPRNFAQDASSEVSEESPLPWPRVCVSLSRLYLDCGKEFVRCPACCVVHLCRDMQAFGPCFARRPITSARQGELEVERPRGSGSLSIGPEEPLSRTRGLPWQKNQRQGDTPFPARSKQRETSVVLRDPQVLRERISPCPHRSTPSRVPAAPALFRGLKPAKCAVPDPRAARSPCRLAVSPPLAAARRGHRSLKNHEGRLSFSGMPKKTQQFSVVPTDFLNLKQKNSLSAVFPVDTSA